MACYHPVRAYQDASGEVVFAEIRGDFVKTLELPCGWCIGCRLDRSRDWAIRCVHESKLHSENCFITLTYDDDHLPSNGSLRYIDFQLFLKRLRRVASRPLRFYMCGEYGESLGRPHYHACLFGYDFKEKRLLSKKNGKSLYTSPLLESLWPHGWSSVGEVTMQSASYIARYIIDKVTGDRALEHYKDKEPEFNHMSLKPGLGYGWFERYWRDWYPKGEVIVDGKPVPAPGYYDKLYKRVDPDGFEQLCFERQYKARGRSWDNTDERLSVREKVAKARVKFYKDR